MKTAVAPANASASADASSIPARTISHPRWAHASPFLASRTTPRTGWPEASKVCASAPPTLPVIPVIVYIVILHLISLLSVGGLAVPLPTPSGMPDPYPIPTHTEARGCDMGDTKAECTQDTDQSALDRSRKLYLDLLELSLCNIIYQDPP